ncbi:MAG: TetR/AcrR family transcriptional regulator [Candidatus Acidiferrales bacterium]|jgi:AcrR family transcriptional regulator
MKSSSAVPSARRAVVFPQPNRRERRRLETRERIYRAALQIFAERGYLETTVEDITEAADVGKGTFFNYFPTKEHVLATYGEQRVAAIESALKKARSANHSVLAVLKELATDLAGQSSQSPDLLRSIFAAHLSCAPVRAELQNRLQRARQLLAEIFILGQKRGEIRRDRSAADLARLTHLILMGVTIAWALNPDSLLRKSAEQVWELFFPSLSADITRKGKLSRKTRR